jgi:hypothetical protein
VRHYDQVCRKPQAKAIVWGPALDVSPHSQDISQVHFAHDTNTVTISMGSTTRPTNGSDVSWHPCQKEEEGAVQYHCGLELSSSVCWDLSSVLVGSPVVHARFDIGFCRYSTRYITMMESFARLRAVTSGHEREVT